MTEEPSVLYSTVILGATAGLAALLILLAYWEAKRKARYDLLREVTRARLEVLHQIREFRNANSHGGAQPRP